MAEQQLGPVDQPTEADIIQAYTDIEGEGYRLQAVVVEPTAVFNVVELKDSQTGNISKHITWRGYPTEKERAQARHARLTRDKLNDEFDGRVVSTQATPEIAAANGLEFGTNTIAYLAFVGADVSVEQVA